MFRTNHGTLFNLEKTTTMESFWDGQVGFATKVTIIGGLRDFN